METITHLNYEIDGTYMNRGLCQQQPNCAITKPGFIHHCITNKIENVSCAECADAYAQQNKAPEQHNLDTAFKIIAAKDAEIACLEFENQVLRHAFKNAINEPTKFTKIEL